MTATVANRKA